MKKKLTMGHADAARALIRAYELGEENGGSVDWADLDYAKRLADLAENVSPFSLGETIYNVLFDNAGKCLDNEEERQAVKAALVKALTVDVHSGRHDV